MATAFVTGATDGIGRATAFALSRAGYQVGVCARTESKVRSLLQDLKKEGVEAAGGPADVGDPASSAAPPTPPRSTPSLASAAP